MNRKIKVITDSTCDLSPDLIKNLDLEVLPLLVCFKDKEYKDQVDINSKQLYRLVEENNQLPKTAAISSKVFYDCFLKYTNLGYDVIYTGIGSKLSACFQSATNAKNEGNFNNVYLIDSKNLSTSIGLILLKIDKLIKEGLNAAEIKEYIDLKVVPNIYCSFAINSMDYLHKGGRCSGLTKFFGTFLRIKPIIKVTDGILDVYKTPRGNMQKACKIMLEDAIKLKDKIDPDFFFITHTESHENQELLYPLVKENINVKNIYTTEAGCVISSHCGPKTIGLLYILKD